MTPTNNEQMDELRKAIRAAMVCDDREHLDSDDFEACINCQVDKVLAIVAQHTKEAVDRSALKRTFNRLEVIDHTATGTGRDYVKWVDSPFEVSESVQDDGRTLKIFLATPAATTKEGE